MIDFTTLISLIVALFAAAAWVISRLDKITAEIAAMRADAKDYVTHDVCHRRRQECPCMEYLEKLQQQQEQQQQQIQQQSQGKWRKGGKNRA